MYKLALLLFFVCGFANARGQDTLPRFTVQNAGNNKFIVGWVNTYGLVKQISIQRSHDSLSGYTTIMSVADPNARQNGFADAKAPNDHMFYRLFVVLDKGQFFFTAAKKPVFDTTNLTRNGSIEYNKQNPDPLTIKPVIPKRPDFIPSFYVYTNRDGYVFINLPDADRKKYHIKFFIDGDDPVFEIKNIKDPALTLDKANFMRSGWYRFELYDDDKLVEKNKFYLAKEF